MAVNEENDQDQAIDIVEEQDQVADGNEIFKINYLPMKMLKVNLLTGTSNSQVQDIYNEIAQIKAGFGARLSQIQDSYKYNQSKPR